MKKIAILFFLVLSFASNGQYTMASKNVSGKKTTIITRYVKGYVVKKSGHRKEGEIQLKVTNGDTVEIRLKGTGKKDVFSRSDLLEFGLIGGKGGDANITRADREKYQEGFVVINGRKQKGKVAVNFNKSGQPFRDYFVYGIKFRPEGGGEFSYTTDSPGIESFTQVIYGKKHDFQKFRDGFSIVMRKGRMILARNPYSTSKRENLSKGLGELANALADEADKKAESQADKQAAADMKDMNTDVYYPEYLVKLKGESEFEIVTRDGYEKWLQRSFAGCSAYIQADNKKKRELEKFKEIRKAVDFYNKKCNDEGIKTR